MSKLNDTRSVIFDDIDDERERQIQKWGIQQHHALEWLAILTEEVGEMSQAVIEGWRARSEEQENHTLKALRDELVQIAAVAVAALEDLDLRFSDIRDLDV